MKNIIIDLGLHNGQDTRMYLAQGYYVIGIDANPNMIKIAKSSLTDEQLNHCQLINTGISFEDCAAIPFYVNKTCDKWSSFTEYGKLEGKYETIQIPCISFRTLLETYFPKYYAIKYIKIDIESYDIFALRSLLTTKIRPEYISIENGNGEILNLLASNGYQYFKYVNQLPLPKNQVSLTCLNGHKIDYTLEDGASGPFGEDIQGDWLSKDEVGLEIQKVWNSDGSKNSDHQDAVDGWFDLHAKYA